MSRNVRNNPKHARGDRSGMSVVEFALLLPFLATLAASLFSLVHLSHRAMGQSYAAFAAARRCAVSGRDSDAAGLVRADYAAFLMPGVPQVEARFRPGQPGLCRVTVRDSFMALRPGARGRIDARLQTGARVEVPAAGTSVRMGGDNDRL